MPASDTPSRTLLVVSGARDALPIVTEARRLGLRVVVCDGAPDAPGFRLADAGLVAAVDDPDAVVEAARACGTRWPIAGVLAAGVEVPGTVAAVADALGLAGPSCAAAAMLADRLRVRRRLADAGLAVPWSAAVPDVDTLCRLATRRGGPVVVRPVERQVGGALRLLPGLDAGWAFAQAAVSSPSGRVMVEDFVAGPEVVVQAMLVRGRATLIALGDRLLGAAAGPYLVEETVLWPSGLHRALEDRLEALVGEAAAAVGLVSGALRASVVIGAAGPTVLALGSALAGGWTSTHAIPLVAGVDLLDVAVRVACGDDVQLPAARPRAGRGVVCRHLFPPPGVVTDVRGAAEAAAIDGIVAVDVGVRPGMRVRPPTGHRHAAGVVVAVGPTAAAARSRADAAAACIRIGTRATLSREAASVQ